ncbi:MAG: CHAT domain-containing tetratricopeptide repeat protein [Candidatus Zixiibacteriota bacterium]
MGETQIEIIARQFLKNGRNADLQFDDLAKCCEQIIQKTARSSLKSALKLAENFVQFSQGKSNFFQLTAYRTLARITHMSGRHAEALNAYLQAYRLARSEPLIRARLNKALIDVYMYLGDFSKARKAARLAINIFNKQQAMVDLAQTRVNFANLLHRQDRHKEAEKLYREAGDFFAVQGDNLSLARCNYNRANTLVQLFQIDEAEKLYCQAMKTYDKAGYILDACDAKYGLAWLNMLTGKYHLALLDLAECERMYREGGDPRGEGLCLLDLAESYLNLGLYSEAVMAATEAEKKFAKLKIRYERAKAALYRGMAAFAIGKNREAYFAMIRARTDFTAEKNKGFLGVTSLLAADLAGQNEDLRKKEIQSARKYFALAQLPFWRAVCDLRETIVPRYAPYALNRLSRNSAVKHVPHLFALWQTAKGDYKYIQGNHKQANHHWYRAAERIDTIRAQLPPLELRSTFGHKYSLPHLRLINAELGHDPLMAAVWSERYKTAGVWAPLSFMDSTKSARRRAETSLNALARQMAILTQRIYGLSGERGLQTPEVDRILSNLHKQVHSELLMVEMDQNRSITPVDRLIKDIKDASCRLPIVQFHINENDIIAFVHWNGTTNFRRYKNGLFQLHDFMLKWRYFLEGELLSKYLKSKTEKTAEKDFWASFGEWLWSPLEVDGKRADILLIPEGELANLPWQALIVGNEPLLEKYNFIISPSLRHYLHAGHMHIKSNDILLFKGASEDLPQTDTELDFILEHSGNNAKVYNPCHRDDWPKTGEAELWHYMGHSHLRADNPFYSSLRLQDQPLFAADFRLRQCRVGLVTLAACRSGEHASLPGEESSGFVRALLEMGARNVLASYWPVSDKATTVWMKTFYNNYFETKNIYEAFREASNEVRHNYSSAYYWAAFFISGAGNV